MAAINSQTARSCLNSIVTTYDHLKNNPDIVPDVFNPQVPEGKSKEDIQKDLFKTFYSKKYFKETQAYQDETFTMNVPSLSKLFAVSGIVDVPSEENTTQLNKICLIDTLTEAHLQKVKHQQNLLETLFYDLFKGYVRLVKEYSMEPSSVDAIASFLPYVSIWRRRLFYSHIFLEVYRDDKSKKEMIESLKPFRDRLEKEYQKQRWMFQVDGYFSKITKNPYAKVGISLAVGVAAYFTVNAIIAVAIQFFNSSLFATGSSVLLSNLPVVVIQISSGVFNRVVGVVTYVASTRLYWWMFSSSFLISFPLSVFITQSVPSVGYVYTAHALVYTPAWTIAQRISLFLIGHSYGANVRTQDALSESLESLEDRQLANKLLEEHLLDYCGWIDLVEQGPEQFFHPQAPTN